MQVLLRFAIAVALVVIINVVLILAFGRGFATQEIHFVNQCADWADQLRSNN